MSSRGILYKTKTPFPKKRGCVLSFHKWRGGAVVLGRGKKEPAETHGRFLDGFLAGSFLLLEVLFATRSTAGLLSESGFKIILRYRNSQPDLGA